ncbi:Hypothetical_protein [Hexamita inflata]|uniref:Hypothetical_protein n=1 Tax=Hexamita inflata TaxID=28002 RepID=A0ABP1GH09_9EUKA
MSKAILHKPQITSVMVIFFSDQHISFLSLDQYGFICSLKKVLWVCKIRSCVLLLKRAQYVEECYPLHISQSNQSLFLIPIQKELALLKGSPRLFARYLWQREVQGLIRLGPEDVEFSD